MKRAAALIVLVAFVGAAPARPTPRVIDVMPAFWRAWDSTVNQPMAARVSAFKALVLKPNAQLYADPEFAGNLSDSKIAEYLGSLGSRASTVREVEALLVQRIPVAAARFLETFPDFDTTKVAIYVLPSFWHFNGAIRIIAGRPAILFGPDGIAALEGSHANVGVEIAHEMFHIYHIQLHPQWAAENPTLAGATWGEGLAAYVSERVTSGATKTDALGAQLATLGSAKVRELACAMQPNLAAPLNDTLNAEYFDSGAHPAGLPPRGAYLIGYLVAQKLNATRSLRDLARLEFPAVRNLVAANVRSICMP